MPYTGGGRGSAGWRLPAWLAVALALASPVAHAQPDSGDSPLRKFEKGAQPPGAPPSAPQPAPSPPAGQQQGSTASADSGDNWFGELLEVLFGDNHASSGNADSGASGGGNTQFHTFLDRPTDLTLERLDARTDITLRRDEGDVLIPYVRYDFAYQQLSSSISGYDNRLELGYGVASLLVEDYRLYDRAYATALTLDRYLLQYRVSLNRRSEFDFGVGETEMLGANYTQLGTVSLAARFILADNLLLEVRPTWARTIQDYEAAIALTQPYWSLKAGYRSMTSPGGTLQGPFIGLALHD